MKTIGFIDYFLSEWHANMIPGWLKTLCERDVKEWRVGYAWAELDKSPYDGVTTDEWCKKFGVKKCSSIAEVCRKSDVLILLAPDNPEKHLAYAKAMLKYSKPTYIDKTFAPDLDTAKKIFKLAEKYNTPMFTASALGFASELDRFDGTAVKSIISTGGGVSLERYAIHQLEMTVRLMGIGAKRVMSVSSGKNGSAVIDYGEGRTVVINYSPEYDFGLSIETADGRISCVPIKSDFFANLMIAVVELFETGKIAIDKAGTLEIMSIRDAIIKSQKELFKWVKCL